MRLSVDSRRSGAPAWLRLALIALLLAAFALRLHELARQDIWWDEARNIDVALRPFFQIPTAPELDIQPPLYYWFLHGWDRLLAVAIGQTPAALAYSSRLLSVFAGVIGVALLAMLGRLAGGSTAALLAVAIGALSPFWLGESQEARMYTTGFALLAGAAAALLIATRRWQGQSQRALFSGPSLLFVLLSAAALLTHYNAVFVLVAWYAWWGVWALLQRDRWRRLLSVAVHGVLMTLLVLPVAPIALRQIPDYANPNIAIVSAGDYLWQNWQAYVGGYAFDAGLLAGNGVAWLWAVLAVGAIGLVAGATSLRRPTDEQEIATVRYAPGAITFLLTWLAGGLALYYIAVLDRNAFNVRYASFVTPALYTLLGVGLAGFARWWRPLPYVLFVLVAAGLIHGAYADIYDSRNDREHMAEVSEWLHASTGPGDVIFVDQKYPFGFYYQPYTIDETAPSPEVGSDAVPARYLFVDINTIDQRLSEWAGDARRVFWVQWFESDTDPRHSVQFLLDKAGRHAGEQVFQGYTINWWELTPPTEFALAPDLTPLSLRFDQAVETVEVSLPDDPLTPGAMLPVAIRWQRVPGGAIDRPLKARVALYDAAGNRLAQSDERLLNDRHRAPDQWLPDDRPLNVYNLALPAELAPGKYDVRLLVYDADSLEPLTWIDAAGNAAGIEPKIGDWEIGE